MLKMEMIYAALLGIALVLLMWKLIRFVLADGEDHSTILIRLPLLECCFRSSLMPSRGGAPCLAAFLSYCSL